MPPSVGAVAERMERLLPQDGTPVLNRVLQVMLSRELESPVSQDLYFQASDRLSREQRIGRLRGQGGQVFLLPKSDKKKLNGAAPDVRREAELMVPLGRYLTETFCRGLDLPPDGVSIVQDTSTIGPVRGRFARPDFIVVTAMRFRLLPGAQIDVHSFELKARRVGLRSAGANALHAFRPSGLASAAGLPMRGAAAGDREAMRPARHRTDPHARSSRSWSLRNPARPREKDNTTCHR